MKTYRMPQGKNEKRTACAYGTLKNLSREARRSKKGRQTYRNRFERPPPLYTYGLK
jgi:hypothetical protein